MKDPRNIRDYENLKEILGKELGEALYSCVNHIFDFKENNELEYAIQQITGFIECKHNSSIICLVESMGLQKDEWIKIRDNEFINKYGIKEDIDEYFKTSRL